MLTYTNTLTQDTTYSLHTQCSLANQIIHYPPILRHTVHCQTVSFCAGTCNIIKNYIQRSILTVDSSLYPKPQILPYRPRVQSRSQKNSHVRLLFMTKETYPTEQSLNSTALRFIFHNLFFLL